MAKALGRQRWSARQRCTRCCNEEETFRTNFGMSCLWSLSISVIVVAVAVAIESEAGKVMTAARATMMIEGTQDFVGESETGGMQDGAGAGADQAIGIRMNLLLQREIQKTLRYGELSDDPCQRTGGGTELTDI